MCEPHDSNIQISALLSVFIRGRWKKEKKYKETRLPAKYSYHNKIKTHTNMS